MASVETIKSASTGRERRQHERVNVQLPVNIKLIGGSAATKNLAPIEAITRDISEGGIYIELGHRFISPARSYAIDNFLIFRSALHIDIKIPNQGLPLKAVGKAVWIEKEVPGKEFKHGIAVAFKDIDTEDFKILRKFLAIAS